MGSLTPPIVDVVDVSDGERLLVGEWPGADPPLVFAPGLTSTHRNIAGVAAALDGELRVISFDCRGRGCSTTPKPDAYGMERHGRDMLDVMDALGVARAIVTGHSMGAYVATAAAVAAPERAVGLALLDGGVFVSPPGLEDVDPDVLLETMLKPAIDRLRTTYARIDDYFAFWKTSDYTGEDDWGPILEQYALYDLGLTPDGYRPKCDPDAASADWRDILTNPATRARLDEIRCPVMAVGAAFGLTRDGIQVLSDVHLDALREAVGDFDFTRVPDTTHHTVTLTERGARATAEALVSFAAKLR